MAIQAKLHRKHTSRSRPLVITADSARMGRDRPRLLSFRSRHPKGTREIVGLTQSIAALIAANTVPVIGVLWLGWELFPLVFVYWLENGVIGGFALLKMLTTFTDLPGGKSQACSWYREDSRLRFNKSFLLLVLFFLIPYGAFCLGHGAFIVMMFGEKEQSITQTYQIIVQNGLQYTVLALILSHGVSFFRNYIGRGEYKNCDPGEFFCSPYRRIIVLHVFILLGGFVIESVGVSRTRLLLLILIKVVADIIGHLYERQKAGDPGFKNAVASQQ